MSSHQETTTALSYTIPLEVGHNDIRDCRIDSQTTSADILEALLGPPPERAIGSWAILETVYERGVINSLSKSKQQQPYPDKKAQMVIKELRLLKPSQLIHELVKDVCPELSSQTRSVLSVIDTQCETVVFFNPYFRMLTGLPFSHMSLFPATSLTVSDFNRQVRQRLGLDPEDERFALYGFYGKHVGRLEDRLVVHELRLTWEGRSVSRKERKVGFFQFQVVPEMADQEILGIERASWLFVKREAGFWQTNRKLYCVLKGTTLFMYKSNQSHELVEKIADIDACRVSSTGSNLLHTRHHFQVIESAVSSNRKQQHPVSYIFSSPYQSRVRKWLRVLGRCRRTYESQVPVTYEDRDGEQWLRAGRLHNENKKPFSRTRHGEKAAVDPQLVPKGEMTFEQQSQFESVDEVLKEAVLFGADMKASGSSEDVAGFLEKVRQVALLATTLKRPGFASSILPLTKRLIRSAHNYSACPGGEGHVDRIVQVLTEMVSVYKRHVLDLASFPASPTRHEQEYEPELKELQKIFETPNYHEHQAEQLVDDGVDSIDSIDNDDGVQESNEPYEDEKGNNEQQEQQMEETESKKEQSLLRRMKKMLLSSSSSSRPAADHSHQYQYIIKVDPTSPARTDLSGADDDPLPRDFILDATVNENAKIVIPPRTRPVIADTSTVDTNADAVSVTSSKSSFSQRAKAFLSRVASANTDNTRSGKNDKKYNHLPARPFTTTKYSHDNVQLTQQYHQFLQFQQFLKMQQMTMMGQSSGEEAMQYVSCSPMPAPNIQHRRM
jgi:hypothetical protein